MSNHEASTTHGFLITNRRGKRIASAENFPDALALVRALPAAFQVRRAADDKVLSHKGKAHLERPDLRIFEKRWPSARRHHQAAAFRRGPTALTYVVAVHRLDSGLDAVLWSVTIGLDRS